MKHLIWAVAASPLLIAATPVPPEPPHPPRETERRVILIHDGTVEIGDEAGRIVEEALGEGRRGRLVFDFDFDNDTGWSEEHRAALREAMETLRETLATLPGGPEGGFRFEWRDMDGFDREAHRERVRVVAERARERAEEAGMRAREMGRLARLEGERVRVIGLHAGARGMEAGLRAIDEALERGEVWRNGERRAMTAEERAEMEATRARLEARIAEFRGEHAVLLGDDAAGERRAVALRRDGSDSADRRRVRVEDRDGRVRVWIDGEELEGDALTSWLNSDEGQRMIRQRPEPPLAGGE
ncbi:hypothetical protein [Glycocaulis sp.]|uniref:hypothetical protein n=1 Tax=Glycocaulis sp. TaxID=1969725 RepID=UPI003D1F7347